MAPELTTVPNLFFFSFSPQFPLVHSCMFQLWVLLLVAYGTAPQHSWVSGAMSTSRIRTSETLGCRSGACELNHSATGPAPSIVLKKLEFRSYFPPDYSGPWSLTQSHRFCSTPDLSLTTGFSNLYHPPNSKGQWWSMSWCSLTQPITSSHLPFACPVVPSHLAQLSPLLWTHF